MPEFHILQCFSCHTFQVHQEGKSKKWICKLCGEKQSIIKVFGRGLARDCRENVQKLNKLRGEQALLKDEIFAKHDFADNDSNSEQHGFSWVSSEKQQHLSCNVNLKQEVNPPCGIRQQGTRSKWTNFLDPVEYKEQENAQMDESCQNSGQVYTTDHQHFNIVKSKLKRARIESAVKSSNKQSLSTFQWNRRGSYTTGLMLKHHTQTLGSFLELFPQNQKKYEKPIDQNHGCTVKFNDASSPSQNLSLELQEYTSPSLSQSNFKTAESSTTTPVNSKCADHSQDKISCYQVTGSLAQSYRIVPGQTYSKIQSCDIYENAQDLHHTTSMVLQSPLQTCASVIPHKSPKSSDKNVASPLRKIPRKTSANTGFAAFATSKWATFVDEDESTGDDSGGKESDGDNYFHL